MRQDGKRPDGTTILPWSRGKPLAWDITVPDTYADAHVANTAREAGAAANHASANKNTQYSQLSSTHIFFPEAIDTAGTWHYQAVELIQEVGRRTANITGDAREMHLQVISAPTCSSTSSCPLHYRGEMRSHSKARSLHAASLLQFVIFISFSNVFVPTGFIPAGQKNNNNNNKQLFQHAKLTKETSHRRARWL